MSVSVGYGIFWISLKTDIVSKMFTTFHFTVGIFAIALAMATFARTLISAQQNWYIEALHKRRFDEALQTEGYSDDVIAAWMYFWPKVKVYVYFIVWVGVGVAFGMLSGDGDELWTWADSLHFAVSAMSTGGFVSISEVANDGQYLFVAMYVIVGVPLMAISCGLWAHQIAHLGTSAQLEEIINAQVTEDELEMMTLLKIEDGDGCIDGTEFTILILVRIGALNPDLIGVLYERFHDLDVKDEGYISYADLQRKQQTEESIQEKEKDVEVGQIGVKGWNGGKIHTRLGYG